MASLPDLITCYEADREALGRLLSAPLSARRTERMRAFHAEWRETLAGIRFEELPQEDRADLVLFRNLLNAEEHRLQQEFAKAAEMAELIPFAGPLAALEDDRRMLRDVHAAAAARTLHDALVAIRDTRVRLESAMDSGTGGTPAATVANRAARAADELLKALQNWRDFRHGYDPEFTWWVADPFDRLKTALTEYAAFLRNKLAGAEDPDTIVGDPIGRDALVQELNASLVDATPEELLVIGRREMEWALGEMLRASREMGCGDDWRSALDCVKSDHVPPGSQPALIRDLALEAIDYVETNGLVTVPPIARECWRMEMMSPERQKVNPFFLGGEAIIVSYPTHEMEHERKLMSLRGNNRAFARATVHHELIPGHHLQSFSQQRYRPYRRVFYTPFWTEGWTLHWEMLLWERGFARTPQERIGMLFWRMHRAARVRFSIAFHLGEMSPQVCVDMLANDVGHERENAEAEVRRSFGGDYPATYQLAYLIGGLQMHALHRELTASGRMTDREFHDAVMRENNMPIAILRSLLTGTPIERDGREPWQWQNANVNVR